ncbi:MAG: hypothetical protein ACKPKO_23310, partial [Candidatus Fonsibacter sp.]
MVDSWVPKDRWDCPPYSAVKDSPEFGCMVWIAEKVDSIEAAGRTSDMWATLGKFNPYREEMLNEICVG